MSRLSILLATLWSTQAQQYGVDCSFPIHYKEFRCPPGVDLGDKKAFYDEYMQGCIDYYGKKGGQACQSTEDDRLKMSLGQPQSMLNYTDTGFKKIRAPPELFKTLQEYWNTNRDSMEKEVWSKGNIYVNHWASPTYMVSTEDSKLAGGGSALKNQIWEAARPIVEDWTGMELKQISQYGIRVYTEGAVLAPHVDRNPLISSCIINVDQDVDEPWPLEFIDRFGNAVNVTMEPGDMVLYESGSLIHARPFPMKGRFFANIFIHYEPTGRPLGDITNNYLDTLDDFYPPYILPGSPWESEWAARNPHGWNQRPAPAGPKAHTNALDPQIAAATGDIARLQEIAKSNKTSLHKSDENGWSAIHEAARGGHKDAARILIQHGADLNARTGRDGRGQSPLSLALDFHSEDSHIVRYLKSVGAKAIAADEL